MKIRDFIYVDEYKLQSFYSQIRSGLPQSVVSISKDENLNSNSESKNNTNVGEINKKGFDLEESKILHDHMYNDFEKRIEKEIINVNELKNISSTSLSESFANSFLIKVSSDARIEDYNDLLNFMTNYKIIDKMSNINNPNKHNKHNKHNNNPEEKSVQIIKELIGVFFKDNIQINFTGGNQSKVLKFRAILDKKYLRLNNLNLNSLYRSDVAKNWTVVGQVTHIPSMSNQNINNLINPSFKNLADGLQNVFSKLKNVYNTLNDPEDIVISPIAIYREKEINIEIKK